MYNNKNSLNFIFLFIIIFFTMSPAFALDGADVQRRMKADVQAGKPLVAHVIVALADNKHQSIVPTTAVLGNGQDPKRNLYWGAMYGVDTYLPSAKGGWRRIEFSGALPDYILKRSVFHRTLSYNGKQVEAYVIADAWDGRYIHQATKHFLDVSEGAYKQNIVVSHKGKSKSVSAGAQAHLIAYIGHNTLMDSKPLDKGFITKKTDEKTLQLPRSAVILACKSKKYFMELLELRGAHPLILTMTNMAPEAYTIDAIIKHWFSGKNETETHLAAAKAYQTYQKISLKAAQNLFFYK